VEFRDSSKHILVDQLLCNSILLFLRSIKVISAQRAFCSFDIRYLSSSTINPQALHLYHTSLLDPVPIALLKESFTMTHPSAQQKTVLITGCSDGGLGAALAVAYHEAGYRVLVTARSPSKMTTLKALNIEALTLDVLSEDSISACVSEVTKLTGGTLNVLLNNAGAQYNMPISDLSIPEAKKIFDLNVWSCISLIQAFIPLLMNAKDGAMVVNHTSVGSLAGLPFQAAYNASKAAFAMFSDVLRLELEAFDIKVVDLKTGGVKSNILANMVHNELPSNSIYAAAREDAEKMLSGEKLRSLKGTYVDAGVWAKGVVKDLTTPNPPYQIWSGGSAWLARIGTLLPVGLFDGKLKEVTGLDVVIGKIKESSTVERRLHSSC
jgi:1-acylglycerone phosphate reductase